MEMLLLLLFAAVFYVLCAKAYAKFWTKNLTADIEFSKDSAVCGESVELVEVITNDKWLPLPFVNVKFQMDKNLHFDGDDSNSNVTDKSYKNDVFSLLFYQRITRRIPITCKKRGLYEINSMEIISKGLFMNEIMSFKREFHKEIVVYPRLADTNCVDIVYKDLCGEMLVRRNDFEDPFEFRGIRDYESRDTLNLINWKATAKTCDLKVNLHDYTANQKVCVLLDLVPDGMLTYEKLQEESISIAAGILQRLTMEGILAGLISNGRDFVTDDVVVFNAGNGISHMNSMYLGLARIDLSKDMQDLSAKMSEIDANTLCVLISAGRSKNLQIKYEEMCLQGKAGVWVMPFHQGMDTNLENCPHAKVIPWEVMV